ncbi:uncharacterized protein FA14DRAFT_63225 [Meira miltonrushii]|uniref:F-box domain-containing protein n=1 Tax=Meira miltonrushii TaxID=1280837 RepID=A0A316VC37_9BASI|nr:uncharacterized protein FA14DRAFT_63225 [Meira miltonrushii]PWN33541.1 hypothetical protein FA14DRAFT_63225 [Meira miltonrushii]
MSRSRPEEIQPEHTPHKSAGTWIIKDCIDALIHAVHVVAESIALLLGMHFMLILHLVHLVASTSIQGASDTGTEQQNRQDTNTEPQNRRNRIRRPELNRANRRLTFEAGASLHLPALGPRPIHETVPPIRQPLLHKILASIDEFCSAYIDPCCVKIQKMANIFEQKGGYAGRVFSSLRRSELKLSPSNLDKLPPEIVTHILLLAATPNTPQAIPTKIALLSKRYHRMITSRLYANVHLSNPTVFRRFRMTLAVHNPSLGQHVRSLAVASKEFDSDGYMPDQVAEHVTLGIGIEQILLASPNLQHLFLDLFSLASLFNGTASRLEKGALPISLNTEFSLPQYLTLPTFANLKHVELTVFGLDNNAVEWFRQVLPRLQSLTIRWVTRRHGGVALGSVSEEDDWDVDDDSDLSNDERTDWQEGGKRHGDFMMFVEAIDLLRRWPYHNGQREGQQLKAVSVLAWPKAYRELKKHYSKTKDVYVEGEESIWDTSGNERMWNKSLPSGMHYDVEDETNNDSVPSTPGYFDQDRQPFEQFTTPSSIQTPITPNASLQPARLRIGKDHSFSSGPRRGPLNDWTYKQQVKAWSS